MQEKSIEWGHSHNTHLFDLFILVFFEKRKYLNSINSKE